MSKKITIFLYFILTIGNIYLILELLSPSKIDSIILKENENKIFSDELKNEKIKELDEEIIFFKKIALNKEEKSEYFKEIDKIKNIKSCINSSNIIKNAKECLKIKNEP